MRKSDFIRECLLGGPGLDGYAYRAALYCEDCAEKIVRAIAADVAPRIEDTDDPYFQDSETVPQPVFFGESDCEECCDECGEYLYGMSEE